jgi:hypothetical protein
MEFQQLDQSEGSIMPPRVSSPFDPIQTPEEPFGHDILHRLDETIDSYFKLLQ